MKRTAAARVRAIAILCALMGAAWPAAAQLQRPDTGRALEQVKPVPQLPSPKSPELRIEEPKGPALLREGARVRLRAVRFTGNSAIASAELEALEQDALGKEVTLAELQALAERVTRHYRGKGYLLARAYLPAQDVKDGAVTIAVLEGKLGEVKLRNESGLADRAFAAAGTLTPGAALEQASLERSLLLLGGIPGADVKATLTPGASPGTSDLLIDASKAPRISGALEADNFGNRFLGAYRLGAGLNVASPFNFGDLLSVRGLVTDEHLTYGRVAYQAPLGAQGLKLGASYSELYYKLAKDFAPLAASGTARIASLSASYPLIRARASNLYLQASYDDKALHDRINATATVSDRKVGVWTAALAGDWRDNLGGGGLTSWNAAYSAGRLRIGPDAARVADDAAARSAGSYGKLAASLVRLQRLAERWNLYFSGSGQWASKNLDSSEKMSLGGNIGVRAYPQGEAAGDSVYLLTAEARYSASPELQLSGFFDTGHARVNQNPFGAAANTRSLSGAGFGLAWRPRPDVAVTGSLAWKVSRTASTADVERTPRLWVQAAKYF